MSVTIYHNPSCGTSRNVLALLKEKGIEPEVVEYLKTPLDKKSLHALLKKMKSSARDLLRQKGTPYDELDLGNAKWSEDQLVAFMAQHPILMNRPVVVTDKGAKLCRPPEAVLELL